VHLILHIGSDHYPINIHITTSCVEESLHDASWLIKESFTKSVSFDDCKFPSVDSASEHFTDTALQVASTSV
jgi:hypothetical protein